MSDILLKEIGERLKQYLDHKGININTMGRLSDNEGSQIYNIVKGKRYGFDKFLRVIAQAKDLNLYWLIWNEGGTENMLLDTKTTSGKKKKNASEDRIQILLEEIEKLQSRENYQNVTIEVYKNALENSRKSIKDLRKMLSYYNNNYKEGLNDINSKAG